MLIWLAMVTGARRGELCALRWKHVDFPASTLTVRNAVAQDGSSTWEKDTKTHQRRRITLDPVTVDLLGSYRQLLADELAQVDPELDDEGFLFSRDPASETWLRPSSVSQRYRRMCAGLGWAWTSRSSATDPLAQRLRSADPVLLRHRGDRRPLRRIVRRHLGDHAHRTLPQLRRVLARSPHGSILLKDWSLRTRRGGSGRWRVAERESEGVVVVIERRGHNPA
jgi:integrase